MLYKNVGVDGVKTGYLAVEKYSLASSMKKDKLISVVSGLKPKIKSSESLKLLNWGLETLILLKYQKDEQFLN